MMKFTSLMAKKYGISNDVSLNTIMVDGTGMCGACRLTIGGKTKFVCIDGPEFNGDLVDWDEMFKRMGTFKGVEREEMEKKQNQIGHHHIEIEATEKSTITTELTPAEETKQDLAELTDRNAEWRAVLRKDMKPKKRTAIERVQMPELDPVYREQRSYKRNGNARSTTLS